MEVFPVPKPCTGNTVRIIGCCNIYHVLCCLLWIKHRLITCAIRRCAYTFCLETVTTIQYCVAIFQTTPLGSGAPLYCPSPTQCYIITRRIFLNLFSVGTLTMALIALRYSQKNYFFIKTAAHSPSWLLITEHMQKISACNNVTLGVWWKCTLCWV